MAIALEVVAELRARERERAARIVTDLKRR